MKRTEPTAYLAPTKGQPKLAYVPAAATDIRERFKRMREEAASLVGVVQLHKKVKR